MIAICGEYHTLQLELSTSEEKRGQISMMTPDMMADEIAEAFSSCRMRSQMSVDALASRVGCDAALIRKIESADFDECFKLRENYRDTKSIERKMCDEIKLSPSICIVLDDGIIF